MMGVLQDGTITTAHLFKLHLQCLLTDNYKSAMMGGPLNLANIKIEASFFSPKSQLKKKYQPTTPVENTPVGYSKKFL